MNIEHVKKFIIIFAIVLFVVIFAAILLNKYPLVSNPAPAPSPTPIPTPVPILPIFPLGTQGIKYNWTDPASGQIKVIVYPSNWTIQENFNRIDQIAGVFIRPNGSLGDDRISIGGYGVAGGQFLSSCVDIRSAESNQVRCDDSSGVVVATKSTNADIIRVYTWLVAYFKGELPR